MYGDVSQRFFEKPLANLSRLNVFPLFASKGRGVDGEAHGDGGLLYIDPFQGLRRVMGANGVAYLDCRDPSEHDDITGLRTLRLLELQPLVDLEF